MNLFPRWNTFALSLLNDSAVMDWRINSGWGCLLSLDSGQKGRSSLLSVGIHDVCHQREGSPPELGCTDGPQTVCGFGDATTPSHLYCAVLIFLTERCQNNKINLAVAACETKKVAGLVPV